MNGILAIDKPRGWTSHDVVARVRRWSGQRRVGHAGTLDPMATGVLVVCLGEATRLSDDLMRGVKWYLARVVFGISTNTDDAMGEILERRPARFTWPDLEQAACAQVGRLQQVPPAFAAIKQQGRPAYKAARAGEAVTLAPRSVDVYALVILAASEAAEPTTQPWADLLISCGKGTYIRAIARDLGEVLACGAHLSGLRRLASGAITTSECAQIAEMQAAVEQDGPAAVAARLAPLDLAVDDLPACLLGPDLEVRARSGREIVLPGAHPAPCARLYGEDGVLVALASGLGGGRFHPDRVFASTEAG